MATANFKNVTHCIFDMDGLIIDSETLYTDAYNRVIQKYGKTYTWEHKVKIMGFKTREAVETIIKLLELPITAEEFEAQLEVIYQEIFLNTKVMPGAYKLLQHLKNSNVPIALATSSTKSSYDIKTQQCRDLFNLFNHKVFGGSDNEVQKGKPCPDIFLVAAKRFANPPDPSNCLVFEDSPNGVEAALVAGMQVVMVPHPMLPKDFTKGATLVVNSLEEFKPEIFGLPAYK